MVEAASAEECLWLDFVIKMGSCHHSVIPTSGRIFLVNPPPKPSFDSQPAL